MKLVILETVFFVLSFLMVFLILGGVQLAKGDEFPVNTYTNDVQYSSSVATDSAGNFVITWTSEEQDGSGDGVYAQRFDNNNNPLGVEFQVNTSTSGDQKYPAIAMNAGGNFIITWVSFDGSDYGIFAQRYDSNGNPVGSEFPVNTYTDENQEFPSVAMNNTGNFAIVWQSYEQDGSDFGIYGQRYDNNGNLQGSEFQVNTNTDGDQAFPSVAMDSVENFTIVFSGEDPVTSSPEIYARRYDSNSNSIGGEFPVNTYTSGIQYTYDQGYIAMDSAGNFVVIWMSDGQDGSGYGVYAQRFDKDGNPLSDEFQVNTYTSGWQMDPCVAMGSSGSFAITWQSYGQDGSYEGIYAQCYDSAGSPVGSEFQVNTYTDGNQLDPSVSMIDEKMIISWFGPDDDSNWDVYAKGFVFENGNWEEGDGGGGSGNPPNAITLESFTAEPADDCVLLCWRTGTEKDTLGFFLIRTEDFSYYYLVNKEIILGDGNPYSGHLYIWLDNEVKSGQAYYYWLAEIDIFGKYEIYGPAKAITYLEVLEGRVR